jgi:hypothetical protein
MTASFEKDFSIPVLSSLSEIGGIGISNVFPLPCSFAFLFVLIIRGLKEPFWTKVAQGLTIYEAEQALAGRESLQV